MDSLCNTRSLLDLPRELLIEILSFITNPADLRQVTLTCKRFSEIVNSSTEILSNLKLNMSHKTKDAEWIESRKYTSIVMRETSKKFMEIIEDVGCNIKNLRIFQLNLRSKTLRKILLACPNLKHLSLTYTDVDEDKVEDPLPKLRLSHLDHNKSKKIYKVLMDSQVEELVVYSEHLTSPEDTDLFKKFLKKQKHLTKLSFNKFSSEIFTFDDDHLNSVDFRLTMLGISHFEDFDFVNFEKFFMNHQMSLREFKLFQPLGEETSDIFCVKLFPLLKKCPNLVHLDIDNVKCELLYEMPSVTTLRAFHILDIQPLTEKCPNVKHLVVYSDNPMLKGFKKIETLQLEGPVYQKLPDGLKKLTIIDGSLRNHHLPSSLEEVTMEGGGDASWIQFAFHFNKNLNLRLLRLENMHICEMANNGIKEYYGSNRIKHLQIIDTFGMEDPRFWRNWVVDSPPFRSGDEDFEEEEVEEEEDTISIHSDDFDLDDDEVDESASTSGKRAHSDDETDEDQGNANKSMRT